MVRSKPETEPKPFFRVPVTGPPALAQPAFHDRLAGWTGRLELSIEVQSDYLHVGSGLLDLTVDGRAYSSFIRHQNEIVIPGSSIKGAVRSIVEAISHSCIRQVARGERRPASHAPCQTRRSGNERDSELCPACRIFGSTGYRGRVHFSDALPVGKPEPKIVKIADLWPPRQATARKFYQVKTFRPLDDRPERNHRFVEAIPKGSRLTTTLVFENVTTAEMSLVVRALGMDRSVHREDVVVTVFSPKLGGAKPRCLGAVRFLPKRLLVVPDTPSGLFEAIRKGGRSRDVGRVLLTWLADDTLLDSTGWETFRREARSISEPCPLGIY